MKHFIKPLLAKATRVTLLLAVFVLSGFTVKAQTVFNIIENSENHETLEAAILAAELDGALNGDGPFTVFAPTDDAFDALPEGVLADLLEIPEGALTSILLYHVVGETILSDDISGPQDVTTLLGQDISVSIDGDDDIYINNALVTISDITADNGVVHVIDAVLLPEFDVVLNETPELGTIITDADGHTLYFFTPDADGTSACEGGCIDNWPVFYAEQPVVFTGLNPEDFDAIERGDGAMQTTYKGWPLYYFVNDNDAGDVNGEGVIDKWFVAKPDYTVMLVDNQLVGSDGVNYDGNYDPGDEIIQYLVDDYGFTLYTFVQDYFNMNTFTNEDFSNNHIWPIYDQTGIVIPSTLASNDFSVIDVYGETQLTYRGWPLYYFNSDEERGDNKGVSVPSPGVWPVAVPEMDEAPIATARAQIIHNAADLAAASVDVFVNGDAFVEDFDFRTATPFVDVPAGVELEIDIAPAAAGIENSVGTFAVTLDQDETYVIVANGIVSEEGYDPVMDFNLYPFAPAREAGQDAGETDILAFHGATDAPEVSVWAMGGESALFNFEYGEFAGYLELPTDDYVLEVRTADGETVVAAYQTPLAAFDLDGAAISVMASGFLNPADNSDGPAFGLFVATAQGGELIELPLFEEEEPIIVGFPFYEDFEDPDTYNNWSIIDGSGSGFTWGIGDNDNFTISEPMEGNFAYIDSDDAGFGNDVWTILQAPIIDLSDFEGGNIELSFAHHFRVISDEEAFVKISNDGENWETIASYDTQQGFSSGTSGPFEVTAVTESLIISGYDNDDMLYVRFEYNDNDVWGWYWLVDNISVDVAPTIARAQIIHNAADLAAASVDVFVNGEIFVDDFDFRTATPFVDVPAETELEIDIAPAGAGIESSVGTFNVTLDADETYVIVANGIVSQEGYDPVIDFDLYPFADAREEGQDDAETDILVFHGATDAPEVSVWAMGGESALFNFEYGEFAGYLELPTDDYVLEVRTADGETIVAAYQTPLAAFDLDGAAISVMASGFLNPADNSDGPAFGLFVATADGGDLIELPLYEEPVFARAQIIHNAADLAAASVDVFVNGDAFVEDFDFRTATPFVDVPAGVELEIDIAPAGAGIENSVGTFAVTLDQDETYVIVANGIVSEEGYDPVMDFNLYATGAREQATEEGQTDLLVFHGATDAPVVSVWETGVGAGELFVFGYGDFAGYLELATLDYTLDVRTEDGETTVASYSAPLASLGLEGTAITVVASGFLTPENNSNGPAFGLFVATADGGELVELPLVTNVDNIQRVFSNFKVYPNPARDNLNIYADINISDNVTIEIYNIIGTRVISRDFVNSSEALQETIDISSLPQGTYIVNVMTSNDVVTRKINILK